MVAEEPLRWAADIRRRPHFGYGAMRVALDATPLLGERSGVGVFCHEVLSALVDLGEVEVAAFAVSWRRRQLLSDRLPRGVERVGRPMPARPLKWCWTRSSIPPAEWFLGRFDVVHGTNFVVPPTRGAASVITVHDLGPWLFPELCEPASRAYVGLVERCVARGAWVHTPTQAVAEEAMSILGIPAERIRAVPLGVKSRGPIRGGKARGLGVAGWSGPYLACVATLEPRKDLVGLVKAFDLVAELLSDFALVMVGARGWGANDVLEAIAGARAAERIFYLGRLEDAERDEVVAGASLFVFPSLYEGFGLPPLEAMALGVPVVATATEAAKEVLGDAALLVAPRDPEAMAKGIYHVLSNPGFRAELAERGVARAGQFSWEATARGISALYRDAASELVR